MELFHCLWICLMFFIILNWLFPCGHGTVHMYFVKYTYIETEYSLWQLLACSRRKKLERNVEGRNFCIGFVGLNQRLTPNSLLVLKTSIFWFIDALNFYLLKIHLNGFKSVFKLVSKFFFKWSPKRFQILFEIWNKFSDVGLISIRFSDLN